MRSFSCFSLPACVLRLLLDLQIKVFFVRHQSPETSHFHSELERKQNIYNQGKYTNQAGSLFKLFGDICSLNH
jgi:hypothetical protein